MQKKQWFRKGMAGVLAALMLTQSVSLTAFAAEYTEDVAAVQAEVMAKVAPELQNGEAIISRNATEAEVKEALFDALVADEDKGNWDAQDLNWEYYCTGKKGLLTNDAWGSINGFTSRTGGDSWKDPIPVYYTHPALAANEDGGYQVRLAGTTAEVTLTKAAKLSSSITLKEGCTVALPYTENVAVDFDTLRQNIFNTVVESTVPAELDVEDVTIEYWAENVVFGKPAGTHEWAPLEGGTIKNTIGIPLEYPAISAGDQEIRISYAGTDTVYGTSAETAVTIAERPQVQFNLNEGPYEVGMVFTNDQGYDYKATAAAIYKAVVASTENPANLTADQVKVEYNADPTGITNTFKPLDYTDLGGLVKFGTGTWEIRISWPGNQEYKGNSVTVSVTTTDSRAASTVALKSGASFTYNMDVNAMKQAIFDNVIDWENSALPAKETLSADNFVIEYYGENILPGDINGGVKQWAPIAGGMVNLLTYPQMGAGEQQIRISFNGSADYRPSENTEGTVTVNKAKVSVKVNSTNIYADESLPDGFITTDPADTFDMYTIYAGVTSNVTTGIYLDLPERYTDNSLIIKTIDKVLEGLGQKTLTQMMNDGVTVGELRELFSTQELLDLLDKLNIDTGTFGQILTVINKLPGVLDSVRISFGTPNRAGLYTVAAVTDNKNYETGVGMGFLLVKMRFSGPKLTWNADIPGGKLTAEQAKNFDFGATLSYNGDTTVDQSGVHYLYSGFTSKWKIYSSTTTPPTEPGRYVVTVCILGGNYMAAPITRSFQITK